MAVGARRCPPFPPLLAGCPRYCMWKARGTHSGDYRTGGRSVMTMCLATSMYPVPCICPTWGEVEQLLFSLLFRRWLFVLCWSLEIVYRVRRDRSQDSHSADSPVTRESCREIREGESPRTRSRTRNVPAIERGRSRVSFEFRTCLFGVFLNMQHRTQRHTLTHGGSTQTTLAGAHTD